MTRRPDDAARIIARLQRRLDDLWSKTSRRGHVHGSDVDFDSTINGTNTSLTGSFQTTANLLYTPPADWGTYKAQAEAFWLVRNTNGSDSIDVRITATGFIYGENGDPDRTVITYDEFTNLSGAQTFPAQIRNATSGSVGAVTTTGIRVVTVRTS